MFIDGQAVNKPGWRYSQVAVIEIANATVSQLSEACSAYERTSRAELTGSTGKIATGCFLANEQLRYGLLFREKVVSGGWNLYFEAIEQDQSSAKSQANGSLH
jgi:hypothetical protein